MRFRTKTESTKLRSQRPRHCLEGEPDGMDAGLEPITGVPRDLLSPSAMPDSLQPRLDPTKTKVFDDELE